MRTAEIGFSFQQLLLQTASRVLVVEDDDELRDELVIELSKDGHEVVALEDGLELVDYLQAADSGIATSDGRTSSSQT